MSRRLGCCNGRRFTARRRARWSHLPLPTWRQPLGDMYPKACRRTCVSRSAVPYPIGTRHTYLIDVGAVEARVRWRRRRQDLSGASAPSAEEPGEQNIPPVDLTWSGDTTDVELRRLIQTYLDSNATSAPIQRGIDDNTVIDQAVIRAVIAKLTASAVDTLAPGMGAAVGVSELASALTDAGVASQAPAHTFSSRIRSVDALLSGRIQAGDMDAMTRSLNFVLDILGPPPEPNATDVDAPEPFVPAGAQ
jgi:hypothetical protein